MGEANVFILEAKNESEFSSVVVKALCYKLGLGLEI
jgi:hypothetical protein